MTTILYIHGLEAGPHGRKSAELRRVGLDVVAPQMPCSRREVLRDPALIVGAAASASGLLVVGRRLGLGAALVGAAGLWIGGPPAVMRRTFARSVAVQRRAIATHGIDAVVASSFGGAVALSLLLEGIWRGPTVLMCPAHELVEDRSHARLPWSPRVGRGAALRGLASLPADVARQVMVVHGSRDETVPLASSERLVEGSAARLEVVDDDHRLRATATGERQLEWLRSVGVLV